MSEIVAVVRTLNAGYKIEQEAMEKKFQIGDNLVVTKIAIDKWSTYVYIGEGVYNSVFFDFYYNGVEYDIFKNSEKLPQIYPIY